MLKLISVFILTVNVVYSQNPSPCPQIFSYEPRGQEQDRWYGVISLQSREDLDGVWLKIGLDRPAELLGNWFGEAVSSDNQEFTVKNSRYKLEAGPPVSVRFFVKYNLASTIPSLKTIKLNGKTICTTSREEIQTTTPQLHISQIRPMTDDKPSRPNNRPIGKPSDNNQGAYLNNKEPSSQEKPSNYGTSTSRERPGTSHSSSSTSQERPGTSYSSSSTSQERPGTSYSGSSTSQERPGSTYSGSSNNNHGQSSGSSRKPSQERPHNSNNNNYNNAQQNYNANNHRETQTTSRRPGTTYSNSVNTHRREPSSSNSATDSNGLSYEEESSTSDSDFFPGDFALHRPTQTRPPPRPSVVSKRNVGCGTIAMKASPLISYGQNTSHGQWPWHAALYHTQGAQLMYTCGATLISENHVLTAAHCVAKPHTNRPIDIGRLTVYLGKYSLKKFGTGTQDREVSDIFIHPQYNYSVYFNDIAVLKLKEPVDITNYVRPCCLWEDGADIEYVLNKLGTVVGWGFDERRQISDTLMQAQMPVVSTVNCIYSNREFFSQFTFEKTYCAGFRNGTTVCNGDSGGGMVFPRSGTSGHNTIWQIRGIVSVGVALQGQGVCDPSHYIVFTDVAKHLDWIKKVMTE